MSSYSALLQECEDMRSENSQLRAELEQRYTAAEHERLVARGQELNQNYIAKLSADLDALKAQREPEAQAIQVPVEGYILDNNGLSFTRRREDFWTAKAAIVPLVRQSDHLAALAAVTAPPATDALVEALDEILECPHSVAQATVPKAGIEAAPPYQVVLNVSVSLTRWVKARAVLETHRASQRKEG